jgi:hypothetical protein
LHDSRFKKLQKEKYARDRRGGEEARGVEARERRGR